MGEWENLLWLWMKGEAAPGSVQSAELSAWDLEASRRGRTECQSQKGGLGRKKPTPKSTAALKTWRY